MEKTELGVIVTCENGLSVPIERVYAKQSRGKWVWVSEDGSYPFPQIKPVFDQLRDAVAAARFAWIGPYLNIEFNDEIASQFEKSSIIPLKPECIWTLMKPDLRSGEDEVKLGAIKINRDIIDIFAIRDVDNYWRVQTGMGWGLSGCYDSVSTARLAMIYVWNSPKWRLAIY